jgi:hypothetical protein
MGNGEADYALITDFTSGVDKIYLEGASSNYYLDTTSVAGVGTSAVDTKIYWNNPSGADELIGIVQDVSSFVAGDFAYL